MSGSVGGRLTLSKMSYLVFQLSHVIRSSFQEGSRKFKETFIYGTGVLEKKPYMVNWFCCLLGPKV